MLVAGLLEPVGAQGLFVPSFDPRRHRTPGLGAEAPKQPKVSRIYIL